MGKDNGDFTVTYDMEAVTVIWVGKLTNYVLKVVIG